jgi:hypothetical protein
MVKGPFSRSHGLTTHDALDEAPVPWRSASSTDSSDASPSWSGSTESTPSPRMRRSSCCATSWPCCGARALAPASVGGPGAHRRWQGWSPGHAGRRSSSGPRRSLAAFPIAGTDEGLIDRPRDCRHRPAEVNPTRASVHPGSSDTTWHNGVSFPMHCRQARVPLHIRQAEGCYLAPQSCRTRAVPLARWTCRSRRCPGFGAGG